MFRKPLCTSLIFWIGVQTATAACNVAAPSFDLASDTVDWTMTVGSGQSCIQGLRRRAMTLDGVAIVTAAEHGLVVIRGTGFEYRANADFKGQDLFVIALSGVNAKLPGTSQIRVQVLVR
jgi:hypothetical protein